MDRRSCCSILAGLWLCALGAAPAFSGAAEAEFSPEQLRQDLAFIESEIRKNHPDLSHSTDEAELARAVRALHQDLTTPVTRDGAWRKFATLNPVLADGHLFVAFPDWRADAGAHLAAGGVFFPFEVHVTDEGEVLIDSLLGGAATPLAGARLESINGIDAGVVSGELRARAHGDTPAFRAELVARRWWFFYWKVYGARTDFELVLARNDNRTSKRFAGSAAQPKLLADEASFERQFKFGLLPNDRALLTVSSFVWPDKQQFLAFTRDAFTRIRDARVKTLIIDVSANGGGDDDLWKEGILPYIATKPWRWGSSYKKRVLEKYRDEGETLGAVVSGEIETWIQPELDNPLRFSGEAVVLVGRSTYSSAILFANTVQDFGFGKVEGVRAARADQSGSVQRSVLPNTGLVLWWPRFVLRCPSGAAQLELIESDAAVAADVHPT